MELKEKIYDELRTVIDPEVGHDVVSMGLIYDVDVSDGGEAIITMTLSTQACPMGGLIIGWVREAALRVVDECDINLVWEPEWSIEMASEELRDMFSR